MSSEKVETGATKATGAPHGVPVLGASGRRIVYDENGKPCRSCNTLLDFKMVAGKQKASDVTSKTAGAATLASIAAPAQQEPKDCPPDVEQLGRSSWTLLHSIAATYPETPSQEQQSDLKSFVNIFSRIYPCWFCAGDFREYIKREEPKVKTQEEFGKWLCDAHNEVNVKLGKPKFDCNLWKQRWKDGWEDGSCD
ncbi:unnamed protein product [Kuraishia capsulata CBS 1993]|uniref:Sulfhydryl oxidase n=1 Tax=Kuraishia capsulata CBS 1993 TaxID=1382522 RepID=W6MIC4_9ASCO|nr:uncharacterized protein KUCA_T00001867001 [Kuraishia capsulata CBS 1993]CDK25896.1 unnamed protein product [Kuraishia capsulata CBS 1993]